MFPVLFSIGHFSVSTFGIFLALSFLYGLFLVWRLARAWELNEERVLDLTLITFMGALIGARLVFAIESSEIGFNVSKLILINKIPGFSLWGGLLGGFLTLAFFSKKLNFDFWQAADCASVGLLGGLIFSSLGCFLAGCNVGIQSQLFFAIPIVGMVGKRIPVQLIEMMLFIILLQKVWLQATHFHPRGKIFAISIIFIGMIKLITEPLKDIKNHYIFSLSFVILGLIIFYKVTKRDALLDLKDILVFPLKFGAETNFRKLVISSIKKSWYNQKVAFLYGFKSLFKRIRRLNVSISHKNSKYY